MKALMHKEFTVYLQSKDGLETYEMPGVITNLQISGRYDGHVEMDMTITSTGPTLYDRREQMSKDHKAPYTEWMCNWCGRPNHIIREYCSSCGAVRPFTIQNQP